MLSHAGICVSVLTALVLFLGKEWIMHKRRIARQEHERKMTECFEHNGGQLLIDMMTVENNNSFKLYGREEVELATNKFDDSAIIGEGGQGTVYIGHNLDPDNNPVAIKRCKGFDESKRMDFGKELLILSRVNHENIVKLLGCSLQFDVPVLVYEYVPNRTLHYLIHSPGNRDIRTLDIRLKIATKSAEALAYLHSLNNPILHGDVKSANILLGPDLSAKVSDFGCSMITSAVEIGQVVKGTLGYLDPEYLVKFELTDKSDVYSFGVILLELLTRKNVISKKECLASFFQEALKKGKHGELLDSEIIDDQHNMHVVHQMAQLAARCLVMPAEHRPSMREVAEELRLLGGVVQQSPGVPFHSESLLVVPDVSSSNTSGFYSVGETTDYDSLRKKASMSIELAR
jgi:serine/threonine protein kinase